MELPHSVPSGGGQDISELEAGSGIECSCSCTNNALTCSRSEGYGIAKITASTIGDLHDITISHRLGRGIDGYGTAKSSSEEVNARCRSSVNGTRCCNSMQCTV